LDTAGGYCMPYLMLQACISQLPPQCMSVHALSVITRNETDAAIYFVSFLATHYQCGEGYPVLERNFQCIQQVKNESDSHCDDFLAYAPLDDCRTGLTGTLQCLYQHGQKLCNNDVGQLFCYTFASTYSDTIGVYQKDACPAKAICADIIQQQQNPGSHINVIPVNSMAGSPPGAIGTFSTEATTALPIKSESPMTTGSSVAGGSVSESSNRASPTAELSIFEQILNLFREESTTRTTSTTPTSITEAWLSEMFEAKQSDTHSESTDYGDAVKKSGIKTTAIASVMFLAMTMVFLA